MCAWIIPRHFVCYHRMWRSVARIDAMFKCLNCSEELEEAYQYCSRCGAVVDKWEVLIRYHFHRGFDYSVILLFLESTKRQKCLCVLCTIDFASTD